MGTYNLSCEIDGKPVDQVNGVRTRRADPSPVSFDAKRGQQQCFNALVFGEDVERHKPAPDPYLLLSKRMGIGSGLVFEDSDDGIASAQQAGFIVVHIPEPEELARIVYREISCP